jgi:hypothetical protein
MIELDGVAADESAGAAAVSVAVSAALSSSSGCAAGAVDAAGGLDEYAPRPDIPRLWEHADSTATIATHATTRPACERASVL